ncbi:MAG: discoidin domain-containing protein [Planctomyces sp.]|nr:discoidin domain-containing protein [Planctomyces sp.]
MKRQHMLNVVWIAILYLIGANQPADCFAYEPNAEAQNASTAGQAVVRRPASASERAIAETAEGYSVSGPMDGNRFSTSANSVWLGTRKSGDVWQVTFSEPTVIGSILQINSDDPHRMANAARNYSWQISDDGNEWTNLPDTIVRNEKRLFRIHRLKETVTTKHIRLVVNLAYGQAPALREVEFYPSTASIVPFDEWFVAVSSDEDPENLAIGLPFVALARLCDGWTNTQAQTLWHGDFDPDFVSIEPRPMCAFFSGSYLEWCQCNREPWRGVQEVLLSRSLPMWGSCGGAQVFAILEETGVDQPWDCPRCRNPDKPLLPIYSHIGHTGKSPCGDYSKCIGERGKFQMKIEHADPIVQDLPDVFEIVESHIGQINHVPNGWHRIITKGPGAHTVNQCLRTDDCPIYAAQFHMEIYESTMETSTLIMSNFLRIAHEWNAVPHDGPPVID